jgi:carbon monoxide dehydrogenase subunit G
MASDLAPVDLSFFASAPHRTVRDVQIAAPPEKVFDALARDPAGWGQWFPGFSRSGRYLTAQPHGVGSEREMRLGGTRLVETVLAWEEPSRWAFRVSSAAMPGVRAMAEDYRITPKDGGSLLTWTVALSGAGPMTFAVGAVGAVAGALVARAARNLERRLQAAAGTD